jgi:hypothetical protein
MEEFRPDLVKQFLSVLVEDFLVITLSPAAIISVCLLQDLFEPFLLSIRHLLAICNLVAQICYVSFTLLVNIPFKT